MGSIVVAVMGFGPGSGSRNARLWLPRLILLAVLAALALLGRRHGVHSGMRSASYLAIFALLLLRFVARARRHRSGGRRGSGPGWGTGARFGPGGPFWGPSTPGPDGTVPQARPPAAPPPAAGAEAGLARPAGGRWPPPSPGATPVDSPVAGPSRPEH